MRIYVHHYNNGIGLAFHAKGRWVEFTLHTLWAVAIYNYGSVRAAFFGPLMVTVG